MTASGGYGDDDCDGFPFKGVYLLCLAGSERPWVRVPEVLTIEYFRFPSVLIFSGAQIPGTGI